MTLEELVYEAFGSDVRERDNGEVWVCCPFCTDQGEPALDTRYRFGINVESGKANCFNCHFKTGSPDYLFKKLCEKFNLDHMFTYGSSRHIKKTSKKIEKVALPEEFEPLWKKSEKDHYCKKAKKYLYDRGILDKQIEDHFIGFCAVGKYAGRIIFPVYKDSEVVGFVGRDFTDKSELRYLNSNGLKYIWNIRKHDAIGKGILLEGIFDGLSVEQVLPDYRCMARLGNNITTQQLKGLSRYKEITVWPDPDEPGVRGAIDVLQTLSESVKILYVVIPKKGDADAGSMGGRRILKKFGHREIYSKDIIYKLKASVLW